MNTVDIVISVHATREHPAETFLEHCYETLCQNTKNFRLILVDDCCDELARTVVEHLARQRRSTVLIHSNYQRWFSRAFNLGLRMVKTPRAVALNCDTELGEGWLEELNEVWDNAEASGLRVGLVGSVMALGESRRWVVQTPPNFVTGHAWLVSMQAFNEVAAVRGTPGWYFDEVDMRHAHIFADNDLCYSLTKLGYSAIQSHHSKVGHHGGKSWGHNLPRVFSLRPEEVNERRREEMENTFTMRLPWVGIKIDKVPKTVLTMILIPILIATTITTTACPVSQSTIQKIETIASEVLQALPVALQFLGMFSATVPPNVVSSITNWAGQAKTDMELAQQLMAQYAKNASTDLASKINAAVTAAQDNLSQIMTALHVVDEKSRAVVTAVFAAMVGAVGAIESAVQALMKATVSAGKKAQAKVELTAKTFKQQFNAALSNGGHPELHI